MMDTFLGKAGILTQRGIDRTVEQLAIDLPTLWALLTVETRGFGYLPDRRPKILFERHIFHRRTNGRFSAAHPDISSPQSGGYLGEAAEYPRLEQALRLDRQAAFESASWGLGQIMGFNASALGYIGAEAMVGSFLESEDAQLDGVLRFIHNNPPLEKALNANDWARVAFFYNGQNFAKNQYDAKLSRFFDLYRLRGTPSIELRAAQARLSYLGFDPRGVDGVLGDGTRAALLAFQQASGIARSGEPDSGTLDALRTMAGV
jgi:hypothetical protein